MWEEVEPDILKYVCKQFNLYSIPVFKGQVWTSKPGRKYEVIEDLLNGTVKVKTEFENGFGILIIDKAILFSCWED